MKKYGKDILKLIIFLSLGGFFVWFSLKDLSAEQRSDILTYSKEAIQNGWIYLIICMFIGFLSVVFRGLRSVLMIEPLGHKVSKTNSYHAAMVAYLANFAFPRLGEVLRCTILQKYEKVPFQKSLGTVITERIIDTILLGILFIAALILEFDKLFTIYMKNKEIIIAQFSGIGKYIAIISIVGIVVASYVFRKKISKLSVYQKIIKILKGFQEGLVSIKNLKKPFLFVAYSLLIWLCYYLMFYVCTFAFPFLTELSTESILLASLSCVVIGTFGFVFAQGGLGAYPFLVSMVLLYYGTPIELLSDTEIIEKTKLGLAVGWVVWTAESIMYIVLGLVSLLLLSFRKDKKE
jgi:uncharacterized protein (TIRG00374 family)